MGDPYFKKSISPQTRGAGVLLQLWAVWQPFLSGHVDSAAGRAGVDIYSIDESFLQLLVQHGLSMTDHGLHLKQRVGRCVEMGPAKSLAKTTNWTKLPVARPTVA